MTGSAEIQNTVPIFLNKIPSMYMRLECGCCILEFCSLLRSVPILSYYTGQTQKNGAVSEVNKKFISYLARSQNTSSAAATVQVSQALPAVRFSCLLRGRGASFQEGVAAEKDFLCAPF